MNMMLAIIAALLLALFPPKVKDFSGKWKLDKSRSSHLPPSFTQVESYTLDVRQTADSIIVSAALGGNGQHVTFPLTNYVLNGKEVFREDTLRHSKRWITCSWSSGGSMLVVTSRVQQGAGDKKNEYAQRDEWKLVDPKTLQIAITQTFATGDSVRNELRVFNKL